MNASENKTSTTKKRTKKKNKSQNAPVTIRDLLDFTKALKDQYEFNSREKLTPQQALHLAQHPDANSEAILKEFDDWIKQLGISKAAINRKIRWALANKFISTVNPEWYNMNKATKDDFLKLLLIDDFWDDAWKSAKDTLWDAADWIAPAIGINGKPSDIRPWVPTVNPFDRIPIRPSWPTDAPHNSPIDNAMQPSRPKNNEDRIQPSKDRTVHSTPYNMPYADLVIPTKVSAPGTTMESVYIPAIQTFLHPEVYSTRYPSSNSQRTAVSKFTQQITFTTNNNGNAALWFLPDNLGSIATGGGGTSTIPCPMLASLYLMNDNALNPVTGVSAFVQPTSSTLQTSAVVNRFRLVASSLQIYAVSSLTNLQGNVEIAYYDSVGDISTTLIPATGTTDIYATPTATRASMTSQSYYSTTSARDRIRVTHNPGPDGSESLSNSSAVCASTNINLYYWTPTSTINQSSVMSYLSDWIYVLITGALNTQFNVVINWVVEYVPSPSTLPIVELAIANQGPATVNAYVAAISRHPGLLGLSLQQAGELCALLDTLGEYANYNQVVSLLISYGAKLPGVEVVQQPLIIKDNEDLSFDMS